jgi:hypothetical protein
MPFTWTSDDRPLETQTAAPPRIPPTLPSVGLALADEDRRGRRQRQRDTIERLLAEIDAIRAEHQALQARFSPRSDGSA